MPPVSTLEPVSAKAYPPAPPQPAAQPVAPVAEDGPTRPLPHLAAGSASSGLRPSPAPRRRRLLSGDPLTSVLLGVALGLALALWPAKRAAERVEQAQIDPQLVDLEAALTRPLRAAASQVEAPEAIVADIDAARERVRWRFVLVWLVGGLPAGIGLGLAPRPGD